MPELRRDPVDGRWVVIAPERAKRPSDFLFRVAPTPGRFCPFCPGNEADTPSEVLSIPGASGWAVRVVPNRFPALVVELPLEREADGLYDRVTGVGAHEVIVETPEHGASLATVSLDQLELVLWSWRERIVDLSRDLRLRHATIFKNHGAPAGATLEHEHSQLVALPLIPAEVETRFAAAARWFEERERCAYCDVLRQERRDGSRLVHENEGYVAFCPYASRTPFLTRVMPRVHRGSFESTPREELAALAEALQVVLRRLDVALERPAFNLVLNTHALRAEGSPSFHWHVDVAPALTRPGGLENGTGVFINPTPPEEAAAFLRTTAG